MWFSNGKRYLRTKEVASIPHEPHGEKGRAQAVRTGDSVVGQELRNLYGYISSESEGYEWMFAAELHGCVFAIIAGEDIQ